MSNWLNVLRGTAGVTELPLPPKGMLWHVVLTSKSCACNICTALSGGPTAAFGRWLVILPDKTRYFQILFCAAIIIIKKSKKKMLQNGTLCMIFGLVYRILSEGYGMRDRRKNCDGLCSLYCSYCTTQYYLARI